jgi:MoxR-like ATPase
MNDKPRFIRRIHNPYGVVVAQVKDHDGSLRDTELADLTRAELIRAAALLSIKSNGGWSSWNEANLIDAITSAVEDGREHTPRGENHGGDATGNGDGDPQPGEAGEGEAQPQPGEAGDGGTEGAEGAEGGDGEPTEDEPGEAGEGEAQPPEGGLTDEEKGKLLDPSTPIQERIEIMVKQEAAEAARKADEEAKAKAKAEAEASPDTPKDSHPALADLLACLSAGQHVYLVGPPGTGKSYMTRQAAEILGLPYGAMSCGPQTPESRLWGYNDANGNYVDTEFRRRYDAEGDGGVFTLDEVDNGNSGIITSLNQALAGDGANFPDRWVDMHDQSLICATANTWGSGATAQFMGRAPQDMAFLDRFTFIEVDIDHKVERSMVESTGLKGKEATEWLKVVRKIRKNAEAAKLNIVVSPRASKAGAQLILKGWDLDKVLKARVFKGLTSDKVARLMEGV